MKRIESLDYLRGVMAISVMLYHYASWSFGTLGGEFLLGKLGVYAVSIFYILSGISLTIVYQNRITEFSEVISFVIKRIFRIFPLFWLVITASITLKYLSSVIGSGVFEISAYKVFLNYSLLFGFVEPTAYMSTGAWSIGNEMVFYAIFPFIFLLSRKYSLILPLIILLSFIVGLYFSFVQISSDISLAEQWSIYINPFNQFFLFMGGVAIGKWGKHFESTPQIISYFLMVLAFILFWLYPASGDKVQIVTGIERCVFSISSILFVLLLYISNPELKSFSGKVLAYLGQGCYSIYLLHPLVAIPIIFVFSKYGVDKPVAYLFSFFVTLIISGLTFKYIEKPMMDIGKRVSCKLFLKEPILNNSVTENTKA